MKNIQIYVIRSYIMVSRLEKINLEARMPQAGQSSFPSLKISSASLMKVWR